MPAPIPPKRGSTPLSELPDDSTTATALRELDGPPEEEFWDRYNKRLEFPLSAVATVFLHVLIGALLVYVIVGLMDPGEDRSAPELQLMQVGGLDDAGEGAAGSGGQPDPDRVLDVDPFKGAEKSFPNLQDLADAKENIRKIVLDENGLLPIAASNAKAYSDLDDIWKKKLLGPGARQGEGNQPGKGADGTAGSGGGGTGADSTRARGLRWVLKFSVRGGSDYISQLRSMGAEILIPLDGGKGIVVPDLGNPSDYHAVTAADDARLATKIQFSDNRPQMVREVLDALGVDAGGRAKAFWAFFPKDVEDKLAQLEKGYRNRRPEDIEETIYKVVIRGGKFEVAVYDQVFKR
jgi:hypothetical protein